MRERERESERERRGQGRGREKDKEEGEREKWSTKKKGCMKEGGGKEIILEEPIETDYG